MKGFWSTTYRAVQFKAEDGHDGIVTHANVQAESARVVLKERTSGRLVHLVIEHDEIEQLRELLDAIENTQAGLIASQPVEARS